MTELSKEYASALFELAHEEQQEQAYLDGLHLMMKQFESMPEYHLLLSSPNIPLQERYGLIEKAFAAAVPADVLSFLKLLCKNGRTEIFELCVQEFESLYRSLRSCSSARIISAVELTEKEKTALIARLEKLSGHTVLAHYEVDAGLLGGLKVLMDDQVIDGSIRGRLKDLKEVIRK